MAILRRCRGSCSQSEALPGTPVVRRDARRHALPRGGQRVRHPADARGPTAADRVDGGGPRVGAALHRRDRSRPRSSPAQATALEHRRDADDGVGVPGRVHGALREAGGAAQPAVGAESRGGAEALPRRPAARRARGARRHQRLQGRLGLCRAGRDRHRPSRPRTAARRDELGHGANAAAVPEVAVPPVRRPHEQEAGDLTRSPADQGRREAAARHGAAADERWRAPVRRAAAARPHHRRAGARAAGAARCC